MLWELYSSGCMNLALYHSDHVLYISMDEHNIRKIGILDSTSALANSINMYVDGFFILRQPLMRTNQDLVFIDMDKKIVDARFVLNYMYAILLTRYLRLNGKNVSSGSVINVRGVNFAIMKNNGVLLAKRTSGDEERAINLLATLQRVVDSVPVSLEILKYISS